MKELITLLLIGVSLSIDTFSVSTCIGMNNISKKKTLNTSLTVGILHFIMPLLGFIISNQISNYIKIDTNFILSIILILIATQMLIEYLNPSNKEINLKSYGILLFSIGVSLDSFSVGIGLKAITDNLLLSSTIFSLCSFSFTYTGLTLGKYINKIYNRYSYLIGSLILFIMSIIFIFK